MPKRVCVIVRRPPYGGLGAAEAVRHLTGALANGLAPIGLLIDDGVYLARVGHQPTGGWLDLAAALSALLERAPATPHGAAQQVTIAVHGPSLRARGLHAEALVPGCRVVDDDEAAALIGQADATLVY